jgi:hypothetical protein
LESFSKAVIKTFIAKSPSILFLVSRAISPGAGLLIRKLLATVVPTVDLLVFARKHELMPPGWSGVVVRRQ